MDKNLLNFLQSQKLLSIATIDSENHPWLCNVYFSSDDNLTLYYISPDNNNHSRHISVNPNISFSTAWYDEKNLGNRKSIQGKGVAEKLTNVEDMKLALNIHLKKYPDWRTSINLENIVNNVIESRVYRIIPKYIKFWNDKLFGDEKTKEFNF